MCGLKWSPDDRELASGGNDNQLYIWNLNSQAPLLKFSDHSAAVKVGNLAVYEVMIMSDDRAEQRLATLGFWNTDLAKIGVHARRPLTC